MINSVTIPFRNEIHQVKDDLCEKETEEEKIKEMQEKIKYLEEVDYYMKKYELDEKTAMEIVLDDKVMEIFKDIEKSI